MYKIENKDQQQGLTLSGIKILFALAVTSASLFTVSAFGQSQAFVPADFRAKAVAAKDIKVDEQRPAAPATTSASPENAGSGDNIRTDDVRSEIAAVKAENAVVRELLRKMEEQQKVLLAIYSKFGLSTGIQFGLFI